MKQITLLFLIIGFNSYSQSEKLIGSWSSCQSVCNGMTQNRNVCTIIEFKINQTVDIIYPGRMESLTWKLEKDKLYFYNSDKNSLFSDSETYIIKFDVTLDNLTIHKSKDLNCYENLVKYQIKEH